MTSGQFHSVEIASIKVNREERQRRELNIGELADSIKRLGLLHPVIIDRNMGLVAGEQRLEACRSLGWTHIHCHYTDELEPAILRSIELEENIKRSALPWQDECRAVAEYHALRRAEEPEWTVEDTGNAIGMSRNFVDQRIAVARELAAGNARVLAAPIFSTARGIVQREAERRSEQSLIALRDIGKLPAPDNAEPERIVNADFNEWVKTYTGPKFNFIHCDFPYGIGADKFNQGAADTHGGYDDSEDTYFDLCRSLVGHSDTICAASCHIMFWFSMRHYHSTLRFFADHSDFILDPFPLVWLKSDNVGILPDPSRGPRRIYETAFFGSRGDRKVVCSVANAISSPTDRGHHMSVKPVEVLRHFFRMFADSSTIFLDPTAGSGSSLRAAEALGARYTLGVEKDKEFAERARLALKSTRNK